jgi:hypothetical protein
LWKKDVARQVRNVDKRDVFKEIDDLVNEVWCDYEDDSDKDEEEANGDRAQNTFFLSTRTLF